MATKIILRQGDIQDLPILDSGELGYASKNNEQRLFVGNPDITRAVVDNNGALQVNTGVDLDLVYKYVILHGTTDITSTTDVDNFVLTINDSGVSEGDEITVRYNTEILTYIPDREDDYPIIFNLSAGLLSGWITPIEIDPERYDAGEIKYTIKDDAGTSKRSGKISFTIVGDDFAIEDNYVTTSETTLPYEFDFTVIDTDANPATPQMFMLSYTTTNAVDGEFAFVTNFWNSQVV